MSKDTYIWCENHNEFSELMKILHSKGYTWASGSSVLEWSPYCHKDVGVEIAITSPKTIRYEFCNVNNGMSLTAFKIKEGIKVKVNKLTKADLESGCVVETREGNLYLVCGDKLIRKGGWLTLNDYDDDLCINRDASDDMRWDIIKAYDISPNAVLPTVVSNTTKVEPYWVREEVVEMTVAEIEKKLGIKNLKIIKEED